MRKLKLFFACLLMAVLSIGQVWGAAITVNANPTESGTFTISADKASGQNAPLVTGGLLRLYAKNTLTISTSGSANITAMTIAWTKNGTKTFATVSTETGSYTHPSAAGDGTWTGSANEIVFTVGSSGQIQITSVDITVEEGGSTKTTITDEQLAWSAASATVTMGATDNVFPSLTNSIPVSVTYQSTDETVATISNTGVVSILKAGSTTIKAVFAEDETYNAKTVQYTLTVNPEPLTPIEGGIIDELSITDFGVTSSSYTAFSAKQASNTGHSDAVYAGKVAKNSTNIQMNSIGSSNAGREIATTTSGGNAKRVEVIWGGTNTANRTLTVYGSTTAYSGEETASSGTSLGVITYTANAVSDYIDISGDYPYIQLLASGAMYFAKINITWVAADVSKVATPAISGTDNFFSTSEISISCSTDDATIFYTTDGNDPTTSSTAYTAPFSVNATTTVKAIAVKDGMTNSDIANATFTKATVLTVAEARTTIDAGGDLTNKYVAGIISQIDSYNSTYHSITYWISDDGTTTDQLQVYSGLAGIVKAEFTSVEDLNVGDDVTVNGTLKKYSSTYEFDKNNVIVARKPIARLAWSGTTEGAYAASLEGGNTFPTLTNSDGVSVSYSSSETSYASFSDASDYSTLTLNAVGSTVITATFAGNSSFKANSASYTLNVSSSVIKADISFECNGAASCPEDELAASNLPSPLPAITKAGYNFGGWFMDSEFNTPAVAGDAVASTDPITLYAKWLDPYTVTEALAIIDALADNGTVEGQYVSGVISQVDSYNSTYHSITYWISADGTTTSQLEVYSGLIGNAATPLGKEAFDAADNLQVGDEVVVLGTLKKYVKNSVTTPEFDKNNTIYSFNRSAVAVTGVTLESTASVAVGGTVTLHAAVVPANASNKTINWSVQSGSDKASVADGIVTGIAEGTAVIRAASDEDASIYAECTVTVAPLSPWATTWTSNLDDIAGSKVKFYGEETEYAALKAGSSGTAGTATLNIPAQATKLHLHAYGWNSEDVTLSITAPAGVTVTPASITLNRNSGFASNSPFTLAEGSTPQTDAYYALSLSGNTDAIELTITATAGKRFLLFGVNQEGGLVMESISVGGTASVLEYTDGQHFDPTGLSVTGHYSDASTAPITEGISWAFDPDPLTEGTTSVSVTATAAGFTSAAFVVNGLTVAGAAPLSPWATTWTSNLDDIAGSKVKFYGEETEYAALKAGSSGTAGTATLNIPAQATELHLHAYGWNSEDVTLSITAPAGVTVTPASITLNRNSGFASNSPFTLAEGSTPQTDAYYALSLSGNTDAIELTITATAGKRFLLFGVNQVGGVVPELQSIAISGDLENKSYKAGQSLDMTGLTVMATYTLGGTPQTPVDVTNAPGLSWTYDPLVENQEEVTVTAHFEEETANKTITGLTVTSADPKIYVSTLSVDFGSVEVGEAVPANETVTVTLTNVANATATLGGTNPEAFSIDKEALTASGDITVSVVASTASAANYSATLTISDDATENPAESKVINLSFAVIEPVVNEEYELVSDVNTLAAGDQIIIVAENAGDYYTLDGSISSQYFPSTAVSISAGIITAPTTSAIILGKDEDNWTMSMGGQLIGATAAKKASLGNGSASNTWTIAIAENVATITNTTTTFGSLQFNYNNGSNSRFLNYTSAQTAVAIYRKGAAPEPDYGSYQRDVTCGNYGTICLPKAGTISGAILFDIADYDYANNMIYVDEVEGNAMEAGKPYIFYATSASLDVTYTDDNEVAAGEANGLYGFYNLSNPDAQKDLDEDAGNYILYQNAYWLVSGRAAYIANYRAYIKIDQINSTVPVPGRRRVAMAVNGKQTTTDCELINAAEAPAKMLINGQLFILRGEKMYNVNGQIVK